MRSALLACGLILLLLVPALVSAIETAPRITDREIVERLTRLEEGHNTLRAEIRANAEAIKQLREDLNAQFARIDAQFARIDTRFNQMETRFTQIDARFTQIDARFTQMFQLMLGLVGAFVAIVATTIGFALWDRRTMIRPFESKVKEVEEEISKNRQRLHALLEALRTLSQRDQQVAEVLKQFDLL